MLRCLIMIKAFSKPSIYIVNYYFLVGRGGKEEKVKIYEACSIYCTSVVKYNFCPNKINIMCIAFSFWIWKGKNNVSAFRNDKKHDKMSSNNNHNQFYTDIQFVTKRKKKHDVKKKINKAVLTVFFLILYV